MARKCERNPQSLAKFFSENQTFTAFFEDDLFRSKLSTERLLQKHLLPFSGTSTMWSPQGPGILLGGAADSGHVLRMFHPDKWDLY